MSDIIQVFKDRRSIRSYSGEPVPEALLHQIVQEAYYSPNAGNKQQLRMVVCTNSEINTYLGKLRHQVTTKFWYPEQGDYLATTDEELEEKKVTSSTYGAPAVAYLFCPKEFEFAEADAYIMANNLCLIARNYDVGSVILSVAVDYFITEHSREILNDWQIPENYSVRAHACLGYPKGGFPAPVVHDKYVPPLFVD